MAAASSSSLFSSLHLSPLPLSSKPKPKPKPLFPPFLKNPTILSLFPTKPISLNPFPKTSRPNFTTSSFNLANPENIPSKSFYFGWFHQFSDHAHNLFDKLPQPVKNFPWDKTLKNLLYLVLDLTVAVLNYLAVPVLALSQLSEMSYCAHERKMVLIPVPFLIGFAVAGVLKDTDVELSSDFKEGGFPWHLLAIGLFFALLKLPGPYYPYWGRLLIPHFANGGLWRTVWLAFVWYRGSQSSSIGDSK